MLRPRVIPTLLLADDGLVKTRQFKDPAYVGDPINAIRIFNDKEVDELVLLDIAASRMGRGPNLQLIEEVASECFMPLAYGGGVKTVEDMRGLLRIGVEKIIINSAALDDPQLIRSAADQFGSQAIVVAIDVRKRMFGQHEVYAHLSGKSTGISAVDYARTVERLGAGEILLTSVERDGTLQGYDHALIASVASSVHVPVIASGGAKDLQDFRQAIIESGASAVAGGAIFVFHGKHRAVLITFPSPQELQQAFAR
jgi:imidazole glycerol-phosphate synthase subunit HisF